MGLTTLDAIQTAMKQAGLQAKTTDLLEWLKDAIEDGIKTEANRKVLELGVQVQLDQDLDDSQTDVDIVQADYRRVELDQIVLCDTEQMKITAKDGSPELTVSRGYGDTTPATHTTGTKMKVVGMEEFHDGDGLTGYFYTREYPMASVISLYDDTGRAYGSGSLVDGSRYEWYRGGRVELVSGCFSKGLKNIKLVYNAGYSPVPMDLQRLATEWTILSFKGLDRLGISSISNPDGSISMFYEFLTPELKRILRKYRRPAGGS